MKNHLRFLLGTMLAMPALAGTAQSTAGDLFVHLKSGAIEVIPDSLVKDYSVTDGQWVISIGRGEAIDTTLTYAQSDVDAIDHTGPTDLPRFTSFKFNNKYNDQVYTDVVATLTDDNRIAVEVGAIGKRLTPSFQLDRADARAYVGGEEQVSKVSRLRFDRDITYTLSYPGWRRMLFTKVQDEIWSEPNADIETEPVALTADMLSTNAPSNYPDRESLDKMLDNDPSTFFHSTWGTGDYEKLPLDENPYIEILLPEALSILQFSYMTRPDSDRLPSSLSIQVSTDGLTWTEVAQLDKDNDGLPQTIGASYTSPAIELGGEYSRLRIVQTSCTYKNYLCMAELSIARVTRIAPQPPVLLQPAIYEYGWRAYGRDVTVSVDWLTDHATQVPRIDINVEGRQMISSKEVYLNAEIIIDGAGVFPSMTDSVQVRGRGNSSWQGTWGKSPYRLKFASKKKPFGLTAGKNWVLLANNQTGSMMTNALAMKVARMVGAAAANDIIPVELYLNGEYRGSYNFTQKVGLSNNSVDLADDSNAVLFELDSYFDEAYKFHDDSYELPVNIKEPDFTKVYDGDRYTLIRNDFNDLTRRIYLGDDYSDKMDPEMFARFMMVNAYVHNRELYHPKSCYVYREDVRALHTPYIFGPVWDFDWAFGYDGTSTYCQYQATQDFFDGIRGGTGGQFYIAAFNGSEEVKRAYYRMWTEFMEYCQDEVIEFVDDYFQYARPSFEHNATRWSDGADYTQNVANMKNWLDERAHYLYENLTVYDLETPVPITHGDVNRDGAITAADAVCVMNHIVGLENETFDAAQADMDDDGDVTLGDAVRVVASALRQPARMPRHLQLPAAEADLRPQPITLQPLTNAQLPVLLDVREGEFAAIQTDIVLPDGLTLNGVTLPENWQGRQVSLSERDEQGRVRIIISGNAGSLIPQGQSTILLDVVASDIIPTADRVVSLDATTLVDRMGQDMRLTPRSAAFTMETDVTGIHSAGMVSVNGGDALTIESIGEGDVDIFTLDGRLYKRCHVTGGSTRIALPSGIYIVGHTKVIIK